MRSSALTKEPMRVDPPKLPEDYERTLRSANAALYGVLAVAVVVCVIVAWMMKGDEWYGWQRALVVVCGSLAVLWGGYYTLYRVHVDATGVEIGTLCMRRYKWQHLRSARVCESELMGVAQCAIFLSFSSGGEIEISSSLLNLEDVQNLLAEWRARGLKVERDDHENQAVK